jgi:hemoglobin/transferrin/lactoferrin receptor protein
MGVSYQGKKYKVALSSFWNGAKKVKDYNLNGEDNFQYATPEGMPAWVAFHLKSEIYVKKDMLLHIGVENILDTQYRIFASGVSAAGRNIYLGLQTKF